MSELGRQIMRQENLVQCQPRPFRGATEIEVETAALMPDLMKRDFNAEPPGEKFVGWSITDHPRTELVEDALRNAAATTVIAPNDDVIDYIEGIYNSNRRSALG